MRLLLALALLAGPAFAAPKINSSGFLPLSGGAMTGAFTAPTIFINRSATTASGINWYVSSYTGSWIDYMAPVAGGQGPAGTLTPPSGTYVTSWARRSVVESSVGYGWTWESNAPTGAAPAIVAELSSNTGNLRTIGAGLFGGPLTTSGTSTYTGADSYGFTVNNNGTFKAYSGLGYTRMQGFFDGANARGDFSLNVNSVGGTVDNATAGTALVKLGTTAGTGGVISLRVGAVNTIPSDMLTVATTGITATGAFTAASTLVADPNSAAVTFPLTVANAGATGVADATAIAITAGGTVTKRTMFVKNSSANSGGANTFSIVNFSTDSLVLGTANTARLTIDGSGNSTFSGTLAVSGGMTTLSVAGSTTLTGQLFANGGVVLGGGGTYQAGSLYTDSNWGMLMRSHQASPGAADFGFYRSDGAVEWARFGAASGPPIQFGAAFGDAVAQFGATHPVIIRSNWAGLGFNTYYNGGGAGVNYTRVSANYTGHVSQDVGTGDIVFAIGPSGTAGSTYGGPTERMRLTNAGNLAVPAGITVTSGGFTSSVSYNLISSGGAVAALTLRATGTATKGTISVPLGAGTTVTLDYSGANCVCSPVNFFTPITCTSSGTTLTLTHNLNNAVTANYVCL
jgi:hypothetical protein